MCPTRPENPLFMRLQFSGLSLELDLNGREFSEFRELPLDAPVWALYNPSVQEERHPIDGKERLT